MEWAANSSGVWPLVDAFPGVSVNDLGTFQGLNGLSGSWVRFTRQYFAVNVGDLEARALVDEARPPPVSSTGLDWESSQPLLPTAQVTNTDSMSACQQWLIAASICLGIGGSLLASALTGRDRELLEQLVDPVLREPYLWRRGRRSASTRRRWLPRTPRSLTSP